MLIPAAGGIVFDDQRRLLLILRAKDPGAGRWSIPGGHCRPGEHPADACVREVAEETGLEVLVIARAGRVEVPAATGDTFVIEDYSCRVVGGQLRAGDDAGAAEWFTLRDLLRLPLVDGLLTALTQWELLPR